MPTADELTKQMKETLEAVEELDSELEPYLVETETFGAALKHPLVFSIPHLQPHMNAFANKMLEQKTEALDRAIKEEKWHTVVFLHERPFRIQAFRDWSDKMEDEDYWNVLGAIWTDSENIHEFGADWEECLSSTRHKQDRIMDEEERAALAALPDEFPIYRGFVFDRAELGMSWTLNREKAEWFAKRWYGQRSDGGRPRIAKATARKDIVLAHFTGRGEDEIVIFPENVDITVESVA